MKSIQNGNQISKLEPQEILMFEHYQMYVKLL